MQQPSVLEPDYSCAIIGNNKIVRSSVFFPDLKPSFPRYFFRNRKNQVRLPRAILIDGQVGTNYFHFFSDVLGKLWLLDKIPDGHNIPLIVGERTYNSKVFKYFNEYTELGRYPWMVQTGKMYIDVESLYLMKCFPFSKSLFTRSVSLLKATVASESRRRLFLNRSKMAGRYLLNFDQLRRQISDFGFEVIDPDRLSLSEQIRLFRTASHIVGIHGAGLTNTLFSGSGLRMLEISPGNRISTHYYWLAETMGIDYYDIIAGGDLPKIRVYPEGGFNLEPELLDSAIQRLLA